MGADRIGKIIYAGFNAKPGMELEEATGCVDNKADLLRIM